MRQAAIVVLVDGALASTAPDKLAKALGVAPGAATITAIVGAIVAHMVALPISTDPKAELTKAVKAAGEEGAGGGGGGNTGKGDVDYLKAASALAKAQSRVVKPSAMLAWAGASGVDSARRTYRTMQGTTATFNAVLLEKRFTDPYKTPAGVMMGTECLVFSVRALSVSPAEAAIFAGAVDAAVEGAAALLVAPEGLVPSLAARFCSLYGINPTLPSAARMAAMRQTGGGAQLLLPGGAGVAAGVVAQARAAARSVVDGLRVEMLVPCTKELSLLEAFTVKCFEFIASAAGAISLEADTGAPVMGDLEDGQRRIDAPFGLSYADLLAFAALGVVFTRAPPEALLAKMESGVAMVALHESTSFYGAFAYGGEGSRCGRRGRARQHAQAALAAQARGRERARAARGQQDAPRGVPRVARAAARRGQVQRARRGRRD
jgi:hypothetical protein